MKFFSVLKNIFAIPLAVIAAITFFMDAFPGSSLYRAVKNPIYPTGGDPWVTEHNGEYFYCFSKGNGVAVNKIKSIDALTEENAVQVYTAPQETSYSCNYWAPELHYINGEWYIYVAADDGDFDNHRMYVLKGTSQNPTDPFLLIGKISDATDKWAIDGTVLQLNGELFFVWSGWDGDENVEQNIYIAHMSDPCTIDGERIKLSSPVFDWERVGEPYVNEGPAVLQYEGRVYIVYSASGSWTNNYCLGMLTLTDTSNPLGLSSWQKSSEPVFKSKERVAYGPGHCSFAPASDGSIWMVYHANRKKNTGWSGRSVWIQPVEWNKNGSPDFGEPKRVVFVP